MSTLPLQWLVLALDTSLKAALVALVAAAVLKLLRMHDSNIRHRVWTGVLAGMFLLPVLTPLMPALRLPLVPSPEMLVAWTAEPNVADVPLTAESGEPLAVSFPAPPDAVAIVESQPSQPLNSFGDRRQFPPGHFSPPETFPSPEMANQDRPSAAIEPAGPPASMPLPSPPAPRSAPSRRAIAAALVLFAGGVWLVISAILSLRLA
ncbi:MAG TPA: hypothetical protein VKH44_08560, partial [Pirellulaceae bacterium]|nr:hypothetical protein [Pirellulaceae bacterium]